MKLRRFHDMFHVTVIESVTVMTSLGEPDVQISKLGGGEDRTFQQGGEDSKRDRHRGVEGHSPPTTSPL